MTTILKDREVKIRKAHGCTWCDEIIEKGETVPYRCYTHEDGIASEWWHPECMEAMKKVPAADIADGYIPGDYHRGSTEYKN